MLEDKMRACSKTINRNTKQNVQGYKEKRKEAHKIFRQKREYCLNQSLRKWQLLITTIKQRNFIKK
jgi:hypothetical protein